jgi:phage-related holin
MQVEAKIVTGLDLVIMGIIGNLMSVHNRSRYFNRAHEVEVIVALVVSKLMNFLLSQTSSVFDHMVMDG